MLENIFNLHGAVRGAEREMVRGARGQKAGGGRTRGRGESGAGGRIREVTRRRRGWNMRGGGNQEGAEREMGRNRRWDEALGGRTEEGA